MNGDLLLKRFDDFLNLMESELCHEMLPVPLQEVAVAGLKTVTGYDIKGWRDFKERLATVLNSANESNIESKKDKLHGWQDQLRKLEKFISLIPAEAGRFYDDQVQDEVQPMCETGFSLINDMIEWLENMKEAGR